MEENMCRLPVPVLRTSRDTETTQRIAIEYRPETWKRRNDPSATPFMCLELPVMIPLASHCVFDTAFLAPGRLDFVVYAERPANIIYNNTCLLKA